MTGGENYDSNDDGHIRNHDHSASCSATVPAAVTEGHIEQGGGGAELLHYCALAAMQSLRA